MPNNNPKQSVLIVGDGLAALLTALVMSKHDAQVAVVGRKSDILSPRADRAAHGHIVHSRAIEIFKELDLKLESSFTDDALVDVGLSAKWLTPIGRFPNFTSNLYTLEGGYRALFEAVADQVKQLPHIELIPSVAIDQVRVGDKDCKRPYVLGTNIEDKSTFAGTFDVVVVAGGPSSSSILPKHYIHKELKRTSTDGWYASAEFDELQTKCNWSVQAHDLRRSSKKGLLITKKYSGESNGYCISTVTQRKVDLPKNQTEFAKYLIDEGLASLGTEVAELAKFPPINVFRSTGVSRKSIHQFCDGRFPPVLLIGDAYKQAPPYLGVGIRNLAKQLMILHMSLSKFKSVKCNTFVQNYRRLLNEDWKAEVRYRNKLKSKPSIRIRRYIFFRYAMVGNLGAAKEVLGLMNGVVEEEKFGSYRSWMRLLRQLSTGVCNGNKVKELYTKIRRTSKESSNWLGGIFSPSTIKTKRD